MRVAWSVFAVVFLALLLAVVGALTLIPVEWRSGLKDWQTLATGILAVFAALLAFFGAVFSATIHRETAETQRFAERKEQAEAYLTALRSDARNMAAQLTNGRENLQRVKEKLRSKTIKGIAIAPLDIAIPDTYAAHWKEMAHLPTTELDNLRGHVRTLRTLVDAVAQFEKTFPPTFPGSREAAFTPENADEVARLEHRFATVAELAQDLVLCLNLIDPGYGE